MGIPGGYTEIRVLSDNMIEAWYQCEDPRFPCPTGNEEWEEFSRMSGSMGSHGGCSDCLMTGIVWIKIELPCVPNWMCEYPLNGYEQDGCGNRRLNSSCNPCVPNWQIEEWESCQPDNTQIRTVTDLNECGINTDKPPTTQSCIYTPSSNNTTIIIIGISLLIGYFLTKGKHKHYK